MVHSYFFWKRLFPDLAGTMYFTLKRKRKETVLKELMIHAEGQAGPPLSNFPSAHVMGVTVLGYMLRTAIVHVV